jgi:hypothetical protein
VARLGRRTAVPAQVRRALGLERGERVLAAARLRNGGWLVATTLALHVTGPEGSAEGSAETSRHTWDRVAGAVWSDTAAMLQVTWVDGSRQLVVELAGEEGLLPEVVRERVEASVVLSRRFDVQGRRGVRVAIRRAHHGAELQTQVVADRGVDLTDPAIAARVAVELADLREQVGMRPEGLPRLDSNQRPSD